MDIVQLIRTEIRHRCIAPFVNLDTAIAIDASALSAFSLYQREGVSLKGAQRQTCALAAALLPLP